MTVITYTLGTLNDDGMIYVIETGTEYFQAESYTTYWPTGVRLASHLREWIGAPLRELSWAGGYVIDAYPDGQPLRVRGLEVVLENRGKTLPAKCTRAPVPPPKVRAGIATRWNRGRWEKHLKREGWVSV